MVSDTKERRIIVNKIYLCADHHFNHYNIIKYCDRPFETAEEMNEFMIERWNSVVKDGDLVYHLGDFGFGSPDNLTEIVKRLNGRKILIMGNHDRRRTISWWLNFGFEEVYKKPIELFEDIIFSHEPVDVEPFQINFHGHIHNTKLNDRFNPANHVCMSVECIDYCPVEFNTELITKDRS